MPNKEEKIQIAPPNIQTAEFKIIGTAPYCQNAFSAKAKQQLMDDQEAGSTAKSKRKREPKDFKALYEAAKHISDDGWLGIPAAAFRNGMISACRIVGFKMTLAKLSVFIEADGFDAHDRQALVRITKGEPYFSTSHVRLQRSTIDIRPRPIWDPGWEAMVRVSFDADQFTLEDMTNLLLRVGLQVGIGEGRNDGIAGCGMGWGSFVIEAS